VRSFDKDKGYSRPSAIDTNYTALKEAIRVGILDVGQIPPGFLDTSENGRSEAQQKKKGGGEKGPGRHDGREAGVVLSTDSWSAVFYATAILAPEIP